MSEPEIDNSMETFMTLFNKMFSETKYNLQALNKRMESMDKCFSNILLLSSDKPFDEENLEEENNNIQNDENINEDNFPKRKKNTFNASKNKKNKMTEEELDEIEKMFRNIDEDPIPNPQIQEKEKSNFLNKKRKKNQKKEKEEKNEIKESKNLFKDIKELLKTYSLDNDDENKSGEKEEKDKEKIKKKRGRKKKKENDSDSNESNENVDYLIPEKNDGYSKFKEFKELQKKVGNKIYNKSSEEDDYDDIDSDF